MKRSMVKQNSKGFSAKPYGILSFFAASQPIEAGIQSKLAIIRRCGSNNPCKKENLRPFKGRSQMASATL
ncbi:hypothetical protein NBRC116601_20010 [Cognatishimia sp. WU-CL00825]